jgi:polyphenol oxidase
MCPMQRETCGSIVWLRSDLLAECPDLIHGFFLRHGGCSTGEFDSLNFAEAPGELPENVHQNKQRAWAALGLTQVRELRQQHGTRIVYAPSFEEGYKEQGDGLSTDFPGLGVSILHADCQSAIFYDPIHHAVSNIHCGWRGNVQNIYQQTVITMQTLYSSKPQDLLVAISPSLSPIASEFIHYQTELPPRFYPFQVKPTYFDLWEISRWQLLECGILPHHIDFAALCTYSNPQDFFSYRREKRSGRHASMAALKPSPFKRTTYV